MTPVAPLTALEIKPGVKFVETISITMPVIGPLKHPWAEVKYTSVATMMNPSVR